MFVAIGSWEDLIILPVSGSHGLIVEPVIFLLVEAYRLFSCFHLCKRKIEVGYGNEKPVTQLNYNATKKATF